MLVRRDCKLRRRKLTLTLPSRTDISPKLKWPRPRDMRSRIFTTEANLLRIWRRSMSCMNKLSPRPNQSLSPLEKTQWPVASHVLRSGNVRPKASSGCARSEGRFWRQRLVHRSALQGAQWEKGPVSGHQRQRKPRIGQRQQDLWPIVAELPSILPEERQKLVDALAQAEPSLQRFQDTVERMQQALKSLPSA